MSHHTPYFAAERKAPLISYLLAWVEYAGTTKKNAEFCNDIMMLRDLSEHCENQKVNRFLILNQVLPNTNFFIFLQENCPGTTFTTSVINTIIYPSFHARSIKFIGFFYLVSQEPCHFYLCCLLKLYSLPTPTTTTLVQAVNESIYNIFSLTNAFCPMLCSSDFSTSEVGSSI